MKLDNFNKNKKILIKTATVVTTLKSVPCKYDEKLATTYWIRVVIGPQDFG